MFGSPPECSFIAWDKQERAAHWAAGAVSGRPNWGDTMILSEAIDLEEQLGLLARHGWGENAKVAADLCREHGLLTLEALERINQLMAESPGNSRPGHELYGCAAGFDGHTVLSSLQFRRLTAVADMKAAFKQAVSKIEIETSSQCNRHCSYCPNSRPELAHRREKNAFLDRTVFKRLLADLQGIDYDRKIALVGMNEFFMHEENFAYLELAKQKLPKAFIQAYSNGDYITREYLERAEWAGLGLLVVSFHPQAGKPYSTDDILDRAAKFSNRTGLPLTLTGFARGERLHFQAQLGQLQVQAGLVNWAAAGHNWAGAVPSGKTGATDGIPCQSPVNMLCLCHTGDFSLCCVVPRERTAENLANHAILGNFADFPSLFHAYASDAMLYWRQHAFSTRHLPSLCRNCGGRDQAGNVLNKPLAAYIEGQHDFIEPTPQDAAASVAARRSAA
jgi:hypothetical protein